MNRSPHQDEDMLTPHGKLRLANRLTQRQMLALQLFVGFIICAGALFGFWALAVAVIKAGPLTQFDQNVALALHSWANPIMTRLVTIVSMFGYEILWLVVIAGAIFFLAMRQRAYLITWLAGYSGAESLNFILKQTFARPRPSFANPLATANYSSFPSGHAMVSLVVYGLLAVFILLHVRHPALRILVTVVTILLVLCIGLSRIYLGVHYFSDVVAGYAAGTAWLSICISAMDFALNRYHRFRSR